MLRNRGFEIGSLPSTMLAALGSYGVAVSGLAPLECFESPFAGQPDRDNSPEEVGCPNTVTPSEAQSDLFSEFGKVPPCRL
jgi:hypothetical protein